MIYLVVGTPGAGKTYYAARKIDHALAAGKAVVTNVRLADDWAEVVASGIPFARLRSRAVANRAAAYRRQLRVIDSPDELLRIRIAGKGESRAVAVLDESGRFLNSRNWNQEGRDGLVTWAQAHRHYGYDVYLISQLQGSIDKQVRDLYEELVRLKNLRNFKVCGVRVFPRCRFIAIHTWNSTDKHVLKRESYGLSKRIGSLYDTHELAADLSGVDPADVLPTPKPERPTRPRKPLGRVGRWISRHIDEPAATDSDSGPQAAVYTDADAAPCQQPSSVPDADPATPPVASGATP